MRISCVPHVHCALPHMHLTCTTCTQPLKSTPNSSDNCSSFGVLRKEAKGAVLLATLHNWQRRATTKSLRQPKAQPPQKKLVATTYEKGSTFTTRMQHTAAYSSSRVTPGKGRTLSHYCRLQASSRPATCRAPATCLPSVGGQTVVAEAGWQAHCTGKEQCTHNATLLPTTGICAAISH